jgi:nitrous oxidase accessory protein
MMRALLAACGLMLLLSPAVSAQSGARLPDPQDSFLVQRNEDLRRLIVSPEGPFTTLAAALRDAVAGDTIEVRGGVHPAIVVDTSITLEGVHDPVIDGGGDGTVVTLNAPKTQFRGFHVRGSGSEPDLDHSGITINAPDVIVENNHLSDVLFGVFAANAPRAIIRNNDITSKASLPEGRKGDGIRLWYSPHVLAENNRVHEARDVVAWYSDGVTLRNNVIEQGRYGVHLMYASDATIERNTVRNNSVGIYTMYSHDVRIHDNVVRGHRGPSGYALGFKDADNVDVSNNLIVDNRGGVFMDGMPFSPQGFGKVRDNIFAYNDFGVALLPSSRKNTFTGNTFWENVEQVTVQGGGSIEGNQWQGNYWSDYAGFDADRDGTGDSEYRADRTFESLIDREPRLRAFLYSPAAQAIEFAGAAMPIVKPQPKLIDPLPAMQPLPAPAQPAASANPIGMVTAGVGLLGIGAACIAIARQRFSPAVTASKSAPMTMTKTDGQTTLRVAGVRKRYGKFVALSGISFEVKAGEAIALWGANGAGKTTLIKAMLGLVDFDGQINVCGRDVQREGKAARRNIGYVPQDVTLYDMSVTATLAFFAQLKKAPASRVNEMLTSLGLNEHANKAVPALSGGLRQRLALAIALLDNPPVLLLDEPTANLDAQAQRDYLALLSQLCREQGKSIIFASHRLEEVEMLAARVLVLEQGELVETLTPAQLLVKLMPNTRLALWVSADKRELALKHILHAGLSAHLNGRGTVVVDVPNADRMRPLNVLGENGIPVLDFEMERGQAWK